jgi:1,4-dihydroxy-6-naphthoate synthase
MTTRQTIRIGHSPDPDDAFMWYPLANFPNGSGPGGKTYTPTIDTGPYDFIHVLEDIQSLNDRAEQAELEITAISIHQYPYVAKDYALTSCGSSMGDGYGPMLVTPDPDLKLDQLAGKRIAIPGLRTSAWLSMQLLLKEHGITADALDHQVVMFDEIIPEVIAGHYDAGLIIHEGQLTYGDAGLHCVVDLGKWWKEKYQLPLPLGGNCIRRDLGQPAMSQICAILLQSIRYALDHREESVEYALNYARDMGAELADQFVGMYVNEWTLDYGDLGRKAVIDLLARGATAGLVPDIGQVDFIEPA